MTKFVRKLVKWLFRHPKIVLGVGVVLLGTLGWFTWQWNAGRAAIERVQELEQEIESLEIQFEMIEHLQDRLEESRQQDSETREIIRKVPDNALTQEDKDAIRSIFP